MKNIEKIAQEMISAVISVDSSFVSKELNKVKNELIDKNLGNLEIEEILNKAFSKHNIKFVMGQSGTSDHPKYAEVYISQASIYENLSIVIEYEEGFYLVFDNEDKWKTFVNVVSHIIAHELVHREQIKKILNRVGNQKLKQVVMQSAEKATDYLSQKQEIMSFAQEAVLELKQLGYDNKKIETLLKAPYKNSAPGRGESDIFWMYTEWFLPEDKALKLFLKSCYLYLKD
jgi:hypothetical protein